MFHHKKIFRTEDFFNDNINLKFYYRKFSHKFHNIKCNSKGFKIMTCFFMNKLNNCSRCRGGGSYGMFSYNFRPHGVVILI